MLAMVTACRMGTHRDFGKLSVLAVFGKARAMIPDMLDSSFGAWRFLCRRVLGYHAIIVSGCRQRGLRLGNGAHDLFLG